MAVIYRITNMANGKYYIGSAESFARREWQHKYDLRRGAHKNPRLQNAWNKYGEEMFVFEVLEEIPPGGSQLQIEDMWLVQHVGRPECYNINSTAELPRLGLPLSAESRAKLSRNRKGKSAGSKHYRYGKTLSAEVRKKIGDAQRGKPKGPRTITPEGREKIKAAAAAGRYNNWLGRKHTEESKRKMSKRVLCLTDNLEFDSLTAALKHYGLKMPTLRRALKTGRPIQKGSLAGYMFCYGGLSKEQVNQLLTPRSPADITGGTGEPTCADCPQQT